MQRALELVPRNAAILQQLSLSYESLRRYELAAATLDRALLLAPGDLAIRTQRALIDLESHADTKPLHFTIAAIIAENPQAAGSIAEHWIQLAIYERDGDAAARALAVMPSNG